MTMKTSTNSNELKPQYRQSRPTNKKSGSPGRIRKSSEEKKERQKTLDKLRQMVGGDENCSQLEVMQLIIDHIQHLRYTLIQPADSSNDQIDEQNSKNEKENESPRKQTFLQHLNHQLANILKS